jgi:ABC-type multidrug transport system ATPase subunit/uncharacterized tellurite resistance protein B-like protein
MSEQLLKAIILLFAILAKVDGVTEDEKKSIKNFLLNRLNEKTALKYFDLFNKLIDVYHQEAQKMTEEEKKVSEQREIEKICRQINAELTHHQKIVLSLDLITLTIADGKISKKEDALLNFIAKEIKVDSQDIESIKSFAIAEHPRDLEADISLIIASNKDLITDHARHIQINNIDGFISILQLKNYSGSFFMKYVGSSILFLNNIPLNKGEMRVIPAGSTIRGTTFNPIYYSDIVGSFKQFEHETKISFSARDIEYQFKSGVVGLHRMNISEEDGTLVGIMGSSGSGKSTLLNVLNGNEKPNKGQVLINGIDVHLEKNRIEGVIGYVPQDDLLMEDLSVYQNLYYAAKLCFDNLPDQELNTLVQDTLTNLGLSDIAELKVGSPLSKTISGGQRKRLNIGLELLREPSVLFVDEPTSGLSSRDSENIMDLLKELSLKGKLIFAVIHQPSSDIFKLFDKLIILDEGGYQIYYGNPVEAIIYFKALFNLVDSEHGTCITCGNVNPEQIFNIIETQVVNEFGKLTKERKVTPAQWYDIFLKKTDIEHLTQQAHKLKSALNIPNRYKQFRIFTSRDLLSKLVNRQYLIINLLEAPILAIILAYIVKYFPFTGDRLNTLYSFSENMNIPAYIFMSIVVALFMGLTVSAEEIIRDRKILQRESFLNLSKGSYLYSKLMILFSISAIQTFSYTIIGNYILEIRGMDLSFWLILFSTSCFANVLGLNISSAFNSAVTIYILIPILLIPQILLSGVVVKFDELNPSISSKDKVPLIGEMMASRWAFEGAMVTQFKENKFEKPFFDLDKNRSNSEYRNLYYVPALLTKLNYCNRNYMSTDPEIITRVNKNFAVLRNEVGTRLEEFGTENLPVYSKLNINDFNEGVYKSTNEFLRILKRVYIRRYNTANDQKEAIIRNLTDSPEKRTLYERLKREHSNKRIEDMVKKSNEVVRIIEYKNRLIQKIFPIFQEPVDTDHFFDFRTIFYAPTKYFAGSQRDTLWFNIGMIWFMTLLLFIALYFDILRKIVDVFSSVNLNKRSASL